MRIALFCATRRGYRCLQKLHELAPDTDLLVFSFHEDPWEPPFLDDIQQLAESLGAQFIETRQVGAQRWADLWESTPVDLMLAVSWRYMIPPQVYQRARLGAYVMHDSLLPEYRGFSPTVWAMINGEDHTGVTLLEMADNFDAGDIIDQTRVPIGPDDTIAELLERVTDVYIALLEKNLTQLIAGHTSRHPQNDKFATYVPKLVPEDFLINWDWPTDRIYNLIRATTHPYSGAYTYLGGQKIRIWSAQKYENSRCYKGRIAGRVIEVVPDEGAVVMTGDGLLLVQEVQVEGEERTLATSVLNRLSHTLGR